MKRPLHGGAAVCLAAVLAASVAAGESRGVWLDVPFVPQREEGCGAAALSMVMQYWSAADSQPQPPAADPDAIYRELHSRKAGGIAASALVRYAERVGYKAHVFTGEWQDLRLHLSKGRPLIVATRPSPRAAPHYLVVVGLDAEDRMVLVNDSAQRKLTRISRPQFEEQWRAMQNWTLLLLPALDS